MTITELRIPWAAPRPAQRRSRGWIVGAVATLRQWRHRARGRSELGRLDDRMLRDIGLSRAEADYLSHIPFWRE